MTKIPFNLEDEFAIMRASQGMLEYTTSLHLQRPKPLPSSVEERDSIPRELCYAAYVTGFACASRLFHAMLMQSEGVDPSSAVNADLRAMHLNHEVNLAR